MNVNKLSAVEKKKILAALLADPQCESIATDRPPYFDARCGMEPDTVVVRQSPTAKDGRVYAAYEVTRVMPNGMVFQCGVTPGGAFSLKPDFRFGANGRPIVGLFGDAERIIEGMDAMSPKGIVRSDFAHVVALAAGKKPKAPKPVGG